MSIGGSPPTAGSITLDNTVEHAQWKSSANAAAQEVTKIVLNGGQIWEKPDLQIVQNNLSYSTTTELLTVSVTRPPLINSWKYKINNGALSGKQTGNSKTIGLSSLTNGANNTITVYGYRDNVFKGSSVAKTLFVEQDNTITPALTYNRATEKIALSVNLGSSITKWSYENLTDGGGEKFVTSGTTAVVDSTNLSAGTKNFRFKSYVGSTRKITNDKSVSLARPSIGVTASAGGPLEAVLALSFTNAISSDKWYYKVGSGSLSSGFSTSVTSKTISAPQGAQTITVYLKTSNGTTLDTATDTVTVTADAAIDGTATYNPITKKIDISVTIGGGVTKWSYEAGKPGTAAQEVFVNSGTTASTGVLGVSDDGQWAVLLKSYIGSTQHESAIKTVTVATPQISITSVTEL